MKIKKEQLTKITQQLEVLNNATRDIGLLETRKHQLLHNVAGINEDINAFKKELEDEYGSININLEDGSYTPIESEQPVEPVNHV